MKKSNSNRMTMFESVQILLLKHQQLWQGNQAFSALYSEYSGMVQQLREITVSIQAISKGETKQKRKAMIEVVEDALVLSKILNTHGLKINDLSLMSRHQISKSKWLSGKAGIRIDRLYVLRDDTSLHLAELAEYGITQAFLDELNVKITNYVDLVHAPLQTRRLKKELNREADDLVREISSLLKNKLDNVIIVFRKDQPKFVKLYFFNRNIVDTNGKKNSTNVVEPPEADDGKLIE